MEIASPLVRELHLALTTECNLRCSYCYLTYGQRKYSHHNMDRRTVDQIIWLFFSEKAIPISPSMSILLTGGEPTLNADIIRYVSERVSNLDRNEYEINLRLITNAYDIERIFPILNEFYFHNITVSIDGPRDVHDFYRKTINGKGTFDSVRRNVELLLQLHERGKLGHIVAQVTATGKTFPLVSTIAALHSLGLRTFFIERVFTFQDTSAEMFSREYGALVQSVLHSLTSDDPLFESDTISTLLTILSQEGTRGCGAGEHVYAVTPDGGIYPCATLMGIPDFLMGNVHSFDEKAFGTAVERIRDVVASKHCHPQCLGCPILKECPQWCFAINFLEKESSRQYPDEFCVMRAQLLTMCKSFLKNLDHEKKEKLKENLRITLKEGC